MVPKSWTPSVASAGVRRSAVTVLAAPGGQDRRGIRISRLDRWAGNRQDLVGSEVGVTARLLHRLPVNPTVVIVVPPDGDITANLDQIRISTFSLLDLHQPADQAVTVGLAAPAPVRITLPSSASAPSLSQQEYLDMLYNQHVDALPEALVESVAAGRRCRITTRRGDCVLLVQRFTPASASAVVLARPERDRPVRIEGRWGLGEPGRPEADVFEVVPGADGGFDVHETVVGKPTAHVVAHGGTRSVNLPRSWHHRASLSRATVLAVAASAGEAAAVAGHPLLLTVAVVAGQPVVLRCWPAALD